MISPFCLPKGGGFQTTRMDVEDSAKALTKSGAAPGSFFRVCSSAFFIGEIGVYGGGSEKREKHKHKTKCMH